MFPGIDFRWVISVETLQSLGYHAHDSRGLNANGERVEAYDVALKNVGIIEYNDGNPILKFSMMLRDCPEHQLDEIHWEGSVVLEVKHHWTPYLSGALGTRNPGSTSSSAPKNPFVDLIGKLVEVPSGERQQDLNEKKMALRNNRQKYLQSQMPGSTAGIKRSRDDDDNPDDHPSRKQKQSMTGSEKKQSVEPLRNINVQDDNDELVPLNDEDLRVTEEEGDTRDSDDTSDDDRVVEEDTDGKSDRSDEESGSDGSEEEAMNDESEVSGEETMKDESEISEEEMNDYEESDGSEEEDEEVSFGDDDDVVMVGM